ncbi:pre-rRNA processing protein [Vanrija albida]|uniref:Pre-rRNA processing protein n=1 Tax=Vanrija albida TaxID=181172 RepID=A0ABR3Q0C4_9TREE
MATPAAPPAAFGTQLANVRRLSASGQAHQAKPAQLLLAVEASIGASLPGASLPYSATAYFSALLQVLEKACSDDIAEGETGEEIAESENMGAGALLPAVLYLLAIVVPETPVSVVLSKLSPTLEPLLGLYDTALSHPPALRSLVQVTTSLLLFASTKPSVLSSSPLLKRAWNYLLELNLDPRPKVRHVAQEGVRKVLTTPVPPRLTPGAHPYLPRARDWVTAALEEELAGGSSKQKGKKARFADAEDAEGKKAIWVVQGLRGWVAVWGDEQLSQLCSQLLALPPLAHLTTQVYSLLAHLLSPPPADSVSAQPAIMTNLPTIANSLLSSPPEIGSSDIPAYLSAVSNTLIKMSLQDPANLPAYLPKVFNLLFNDLLLAPSAPKAVLDAAADAISNGIVRFCISDDAIVATIAYLRHGSHAPGARKKQKTPFLTRVLAAVTDALDAHALRMPYLFTILTALVSRLRLRVTPGEPQIDTEGTAPTAAEELLLPLITEVGDLRVQKGFEAKDKVDEVVGMAIEVIGVEGVLRALPLNIEPDASGRTPQPGRAHLLPLIRSRTTNDSLAFFADYFRPLSERIFERKVAAEDADKAAEAKIWEVIVGQIWDCLPGFCEMPRDLKEGLTTPFLSLITNLLYTQPLLLSPLLRGLSQVVKSTQTLAASTADPAELRKQFGVDQEAAAANIEVLKGLAKDMVSVLLNVFSKLAREQRGMVGEVIGTWVSIMSDQDIVETYNTVASHLSANLHSTTTPAEGASPISHTMLDLLIIFVPHLPAAQSSALFAAVSNKELLEHIDATVQKKSYRVLKRLLEAGKLGPAASGDNLENFVERLNEVATGVGPGAQRDRLQLLTTLVDVIPKDRLHLIPEILSEAVLGTKEVNEKARDAGFDLLVVMGHKMAQGGEVKQSVPVDEDSEEMAENTVEANVQEYITMVAAGLTGTTPHMISASINALSRLLFEFKDEVSNELISELVATIVVFVGSKNREIVKSALGFIKVAVVALPVETVEPHLNTLVPALLGWVHDHKNHFKSKTVHIFERMIRKFGFDTVYRHAPEGGERKVLDNIRRRKERAKRKKANADESGDEDKPKTSSGNAFDDILYNSDSDLGSDNEEERVVKPLSKRQRKAQAAAEAAAYIRHDGDEPMDLLSRSIAGGITRADPAAAARKRKPGQDAAHFKTDKSGKMVIEESGDEDDGDDSMAADRAAGAGNAFLSAMQGTDGATRDARGNLKFNKNTKRSRDEDREDEAMDLDELIGDRPKKAPKKKQQVQKLGEEFRSRRAGGDVKKNGGPDPFSYVPIGQAAQRKGQKGQRVSLTNKKKGSRA